MSKVVILVAVVVPVTLIAVAWFMVAAAAVLDHLVGARKPVARSLQPRPAREPTPALKVNQGETS